MSSVVIINALYPPEPMVSAQMGQDVAIHLAQSGARVTVICPHPSRPFGVKFDTPSALLDAQSHVDEGVAVIRVPSFVAPASRLLGRMWESWSFGRHACRQLEQRIPDADVVYANVWPLLAQFLIARHCRRKHIPLILHIQDVYPESLLDRLPRLSRGIAASMLTALDRWVARRATQVAVISENMSRIYIENRGLAPDKVVIVRDWVDDSRFARLPARGVACGRYQIPEEKFTFLYLGNIGPVAGVEGLITAFHASGLKGAQLVIAGDGSAKMACVERARVLGAEGVRFISDPEAANVPSLQSLGHVCLLPLRKRAGMSSVPSKLMTYLLSAKPVLAAVDAESDTARCISEAQCGWVGEPEDLKWLSSRMAEAYALPAEALDAMGQRGRIYGLRHYAKAEGVKRLAAVIESAGRGPPSVASVRFDQGRTAIAGDEPKSQGIETGMPIKRSRQLLSGTRSHRSEEASSTGIGSTEI